MPTFTTSVVAHVIGIVDDVAVTNAYVPAEFEAYTDRTVVDARNPTPRNSAEPVS